MATSKSASLPIIQQDLSSVIAALADTITNNKNDLIVAGDEVEFHEGKKISLPKGMTYPGARKILDRLEQEAQAVTAFSRTFKYRPMDGAYAAAKVLRDLYGMVLGEKMMTFFGPIPPQTISVTIAYGKTVTVPWNTISIPSLPGLELLLGSTRDKDYGQIFYIGGEGPRKYKDEFDRMCDAIEVYLKTQSIYRGQAMSGSDDLEFLDLSHFDASRIVFSDQVTATLEGTLWAPLKYTQALREDKISLKRAVLAYGEYGTGKTSLGLMAAQIAVENNWTFISARPGVDKVEDVLRTARLYQPAIVFVEDIDIQTGNGTNTQDEVSTFLDAFDGITAKGGEIIAVMTSNHLDRIHKGMLRPGRLDAVIEIAALDRNGVERLIKVILENKVDPDTNYDAIYAAMTGFTPAFVKEAIERAKTFAIARLEGDAAYILTTEDLVNSAVSLHSQLEAINAASEGITVPQLDVALRNTVREAFRGSYVASGSPLSIVLEEIDLSTMEPTVAAH